MEVLSVIYQQSLQELYLRIVMTASGIKNEIDDTMFQHKSFQEFSKYITQLKAVIEELERKRIETLSVESVLQTLDFQLKRCYNVIREYKSGSPFLRFLKSSDLLSQMQLLMKEIAMTVKVLGSSSMELTLELKSKFDQMVKDLESLEFESAVKTEAIIVEIENLTNGCGGNREKSIELMMKIAERVGVTVNPTQLQEELNLLKQEKEALEAQKKRAEALQVSQLIQLLDSTEMAPKEQQRNSIDGGSRNQQSMIGSFTCPLCNQIMEDPVAISCGHSFERRAIQERFDGGDMSCPTCGEEVSFPDLTANYSLKNSIEEWKQGSLDFKLLNAEHGIASDDIDLLNQALEDLQVVMENPNYIEKVVELGLIPRIVNSLKITSVNSKAAFKCLFYLAKQSDENKEMIADAGAIRFIIKQFCKGKADLHAIEVLQELSGNKEVADKIGDEKDCIPILVSLANTHNYNTDISQKAEKVLQNLCFNTHFVIKMAEVGHFQPFTTRFAQGSLETKASMASELVKMQLNDYQIKRFEQKQFIIALTQMLLSSSPASKSACLQCMKKLLTFPAMAKQFSAEQTTIPGLVGIIAFPGTGTHLKQAAAEALAALIRAIQLSDIQDDPYLQELQTEHNIGLFLSLAASSDATTKTHFLQLLLTISQKSSKARSLIRSDNSAISNLFISLDQAQSATVRQAALKLINCIAEDNPTGVSLPASPTDMESAIQALVTILTSSLEIDERSMAAGIIGQLPTNESNVDEVLCKSDAIKAIHQVIISELEDSNAGDSSSLLENALAALLRYTEPNKPELTIRASELELFPSLVRILSTGSPLAKKRTAMALAQLSIASSAVSPIEHSPGTGHRGFSWTLRKLCCCCTAPSPELCTVHGDRCSSSRSFCLVKVNAVGPLVEALSEMKTGVAEAALLALDTLLKDEGTRADAAKAIGRYHGVPAILNVLEKGDTAARERALGLFDKILSSSVIERPQLQRSHKILIQLLQDEVLKKKAALVLGKQGVIPQQSSYF